ncbi:hypothetical protein RHS04_01980 [Rhizoctonia solani]|uniref:Uncharacterized protein n=1 Tax=Rhizoctonia solani TaxID=456999 RepID=A0A8H7HCN1_9AGAM|nr:hypothetical protein RHS04_01980 [Rhizoctonia solani]KAF8756103.1 hypothetical protein RHS01_04975 [Rhizoctonia solani]
MQPDSELSGESRHTGRRKKRRSLSDSIGLVGSYTIGWAAPTEQVRYLVEKGDAIRAMSTIMFADVELDAVAFGFGVVSLLSSLISIGFGTGLMYVLGDVAGETLKKIGTRYPILFVFALSIPQVWAGICIVTFFLCTGVFAWNASDKGWTAKAGIILSAVLTVGHLIAFARLFHKQHTVENLIDNEGDGGMEHNIHIAHLAQRMAKFSDEPDQGERKNRPEFLDFTAQYGGSGLGHFRNSPPGSMSAGIEQQLGKPVVQSPDPMVQEFQMGSRRSPNVTRSLNTNGNGDRNGSERSRVSGGLFDATEGMTK